jgi:hypothetical protein
MTVTLQIFIVFPSNSAIFEECAEIIIRAFHENFGESAIPGLRWNNAHQIIGSSTNQAASFFHDAADAPSQSQLQLA